MEFAIIGVIFGSIISIAIVLYFRKRDAIQFTLKIYGCGKTFSEIETYEAVLNNTSSIEAIIFGVSLTTKFIGTSRNHLFLQLYNMSIPPQCSIAFCISGEDILQYKKRYSVFPEKFSITTSLGYFGLNIEQKRIGKMFCTWASLSDNVKAQRSIAFKGYKERHKEPSYLHL